MSTNPTPRLMLEVEGRTWPVHEGDIIGRLGTVGREELMQHDVLSRQHLQVNLIHGRWHLTQLPEAHNETLLNGRLMLPGTPVLLEETSDVQVVTCHFRLHREQRTAGVGGHPVALLTLDSLFGIAWRNSEAATLLHDELPGGGDFLQAFDSSSVVRLRHLLGSLVDGQRLQETEAMLQSHAEGEPTTHSPVWLAVQAVRSGDQVLVTLRDITRERLQREAVQSAANRLDTKIRALTTLLTAEPFVQGDLAAALPLLVEDAADLLEETEVSAWLCEQGVPERKPGPPAAEAPFTVTCRAVAGIAGSATARLARRARLSQKPPRGEVTPESQSGWHISGLLDGDHVENPAWIEPLGGDGLLLFRRTRLLPHGWLEPETQMAGLTAALGRQLFANAQRRDAIETLQSREAALSAELSDAAQYVESRLPPRIKDGPVAVDWVFRPSGRLGGDVFGYEWLDDQRFALYIADVMGHGSKAALHGLAVAQALRLLLSRSGPDLEDPSRWLAALNTEFPMAQHQGLLWTMWCGIFHTGTRELRFASGGHPPALLITGREILPLSTDGPVLGAMTDVEYRGRKVKLPAEAKLFLYTDGAYEFPTAGGEAGTLEDFTAAVSGAAGKQDGECAFLETRAAALCAEPEFPDDFTIVRARFAR